MLEFQPRSDSDVTRLPPARVQATLKRVAQIMLIVLVPLAAASGWRAWVQIWTLDLAITDPRLVAGSVVTVSATTSGRVTVNLSLELVRDGRAELLAASQVRTGRNPAMDPRPRHGVLTFVITDDIARRWSGGPATLRATARGRMQFMREPPPQVRELRVGTHS